MSWISIAVVAQSTDNTDTDSAHTSTHVDSLGLMLY